jgi:hypothetical protein
MPQKSVSRPILSVRDTLFVVALDIRTDWKELPDPRQVAAWRAWWAMERAEREILPLIIAIGRAEPPVLRDAGS